MTRRNKRSIEDHFDKSYELEYTLQKAGKDLRLTEIRKVTDLADICYSDRRNRDVLEMQSTALKSTSAANPLPFF